MSVKRFFCLTTGRTPQKIYGMYDLAYSLTRFAHYTYYSSKYFVEKIKNYHLKVSP